MKRLIKTAALVLFLSFPVVSHADLNIFSVETPVVKREVADKLAGGSHIATDHSLVNTLVPQKLNNSIQSPDKLVFNESFFVFGVDLNSLNVI
jgi:hypothetical protein